MNENDPRDDGAAGAAPADAAPRPAPDAAPLPSRDLRDPGPPLLGAESTPPLEAVHASVAVASDDDPAGSDSGASDSDGGGTISASPGAGPVVRRALGYAAAAVAGGVIVLAVLAAGGRLGTGNGSSATASPDASGAASGAAPVLGDPAAPVLVEIWADYQCPYCGVLSHAIEPALQRDYVEPGRIRLAYRDFAFLGQESTEAAAAARCAGRQGGYWHYHDLLFASQQGENQGAFAPENLLGIAKYAGLDTKAFATCMGDTALRTAVADETAQGRALGVASTPTLHFVGPKGAKIVKGLTTLAVIDAAIEEVTTGVAPSASPGPGGSPSGAPASSSSAGSESPSPAAPSVTSPAP